MLSPSVFGLRRPKTLGRDPGDAGEGEETVIAGRNILLRNKRRLGRAGLRETEGEGGRSEERINRRDTFEYHQDVEGGFKRVFETSSKSHSFYGP